jgi:exosortase/archaeosortase family protein
MKIAGIILRYAIIVLSGIFMDVFYTLFFPLTIYPVYALLSVFYLVSLSGSIIIASSEQISIIDACIAGSAYFLLFALNLSLPKISLGKRIAMLAFEFTAFLAINILRIFFLSVLLINKSSSFDAVHQFLWYAVSILIVALIWICAIRLFRIREVPFLSDIRGLLNKARK